MLHDTNEFSLSEQYAARYDKGRVMQTEQQRAVTRLCISVDYFFCNMVRKARWLMSFLTTGSGAGNGQRRKFYLFERIVLTTIKDGQCLTSTRKNHDAALICMW